MATRDQLWNWFCEEHRILTQAVPLFLVDDRLIVSTREIGSKTRRNVLQRSPEMESVILHQAESLITDWKCRQDDFDGLIYVMFRRQTDKVVPLYIGKTETIGKGDRNLSANLTGLENDKGKFARWGDNYAYHIGDLSAVVLPGHPESKRTAKYEDWAAALFEQTGINQPKLKEPVYFWSKAWRKTDVGIWQDFGPTRLSFLEYLLIGVASAVYPTAMLNREGQNRGM